LAQSRVVDEGEARILKTIEELTQRMINVKYRNCLRAGIDGFCGYWVLKELPEQAKQLNQKESERIFKKLSSADGKASSWRLKPFPPICNNCPAYFDEQMISLLGTRTLSFK
jgi:hypothetical protein